MARPVAINDRHALRSLIASIPESRRDTLVHIARDAPVSRSAILVGGTAGLVTGAMAIAAVVGRLVGTTL